MKERFINIKKAVGEKVDGLLKAVFDAPPSYEEILLTFNHGKNCSMTNELEKIESSQYPIFHDSSGGIGINSTPVSVKFLECPECHRSTRYSG